MIAALQAQSRLDSVQLLDEAVVVARQYKEIIPAQRLEGEQLQRLNSHSLADALRYFAGVQIKDYGGMGGLKTINVRNMGSHHVGVFTMACKSGMPRMELSISVVFLWTTWKRWLCTTGKKVKYFRLPRILHRLRLFI